jgi:hypothetical protein
MPDLAGVRSVSGVAWRWGMAAADVAGLLDRLTGQAGRMGGAAGDDPAGYVPIGPKPYLDRFASEYRLTGADLRHKIQRRTASFRIGGDAFDVEYLVHESLLRSHGEFPCAGDAAALQFCKQIAREMVVRFGVTRDEAVAAINRQWSNGEPDGRTPRVWIVGLDIAYHETPGYWAARILHGDSSP